LRQRSATPEGAEHPPDLPDPTTEAEHLRFDVIVVEDFRPKFLAKTSMGRKQRVVRLVLPHSPKGMGGTPTQTPPWAADDAEMEPSTPWSAAPGGSPSQESQPELPLGSGGMSAEQISAHDPTVAPHNEHEHPDNEPIPANFMTRS
jgi:hypothetical protein